MGFDIPGFKVDDTGTYFIVLVFDKFVIKIPRPQNDKRRKEKLAKITAAHNYLSGKVRGVLPCENRGDFIVMPRAPGVRADTRKDIEGHIDKLRIKLMQEIEAADKELFPFIKNDMGKTNLFYDEAGDCLYLVDVHGAIDRK